MKTRWIQAAAILWAGLTLTGCFESSHEVEVGEAVQIRLRNNTGADFDRVVVSFPEDVEDYGAVVSESASGYREVSFAYSFAMVDAYYGHESLRIQPIDNIGESALSAGLYTYTLFIVDDELRMSMSRD